jgi:multidrug efflux system membrane fusion protein
MRPIKVTSSNDEETIIASGVKPGETVVTDGQLRLTPASKVQVKNKV